MTMLRATELATRLSVSKGRVSQYVAEGKLDGCYQGEGRARRFDLGKCAEALGRRLDHGQLMGNGAGTRRALGSIESDAGKVGQEAGPSEARQLRDNDPDRYELARTLKAEEEARRLRRQNLEAEGTFVLAAEARRQAARQIGQEIAEIETMLRDGARRVADVTGTDYKQVRQLLMETWRAHRGSRSDALARQARVAPLSGVESEADV
ncbi:hypothetical protein [Limimaricola pyoseonensis]|uniref:Helix-turn-helix domain-containing protein n=1 Tax=Limimaricola pyoseonensis TaxID=521013 RepID=A0A1G7GQW9_9RHOB|nr:hypothetical protein [Limimaricola pyoseonensis]SDE90481.1 hypothetical protein SAMN04488567_2885 [Limimaricola pyoseonensis]